MSSILQFTFSCTDRFNKNHELQTSFTFENGSYKDQLEKLKIFQHDVNDLTTQMVNKEKADLKDKENKLNSGVKSDEEHYQSDESEDDEKPDQKTNGNEVEKKKPKLV